MAKTGKQQTSRVSAKPLTPATAASERPARARKAPSPPTLTQPANVSKKRNPPKTKAKAKSTTTKKTAPKTAGKKSTAVKQEKTKPAANTSRKRKAEDDGENKVAKKQAVEKPRRVVKAPVARQPKPVKEKKKGPVISEAPTAVREILVFGEGTAGELGLGTASNAVDVTRPRFNANLPGDKVGSVQVSAGGMHAALLTHDNQILTWGVNDTGALGRDTTWNGGTRDIDDEDDSGSDDDNGLNPHEAIPAPMDFSESGLLPDTKFVQVVAGDTCTFVVTDDGLVYGTGTFRSNDGTSQFTPDVQVATRPILIAGLKNIMEIACGSTHAVARDNKGKVWAWGFGDQHQLGRRIVERTKTGSLVPREVSMPRGAKNNIKKIASGPYHSFAISNDDELYSWGLNAYGQTGVDPESAGNDDALTTIASKVKNLDGKKIVAAAGGSFHSIIATAEGECLVWGRVDAGQLGLPRPKLEELGDVVKKNDRGQLALLPIPTHATLIEGHVDVVSAGPEHSLVVTKDGHVYSTGFSANYQTGLGSIDDVNEFTRINNRAVNERKVIGAHAGAQYGILSTAYQPAAAAAAA